MKKFELIVGIDLAKLTLTVCSGNNPEQTKLFTIDNTVEALSGLIEELMSQVSTPSAILVCFEYTGNCGDKLTHLLAGAGIVTWAIHPQVGSSYSTVLSREKNDDIDTLNLWEFAYVHQHKVEPYVLPSESTLKIKELQTARKQYVKKRTATINQIKDLKQKMKPGDIVLDLHVKTLKGYNENIDFLNDEIEKEIKNNPILKRQKQILKSIPGIGEVTSTHLIAISDGFEKFDYNPKKIAAFIGSAPYDKQSGTSLKNKKRTSKKAYRVLKGELSQAAVSVATRKGQFFYDYYQAKIEKGKAHNWIINAIINMLLKIVCSLIKKNQLFDKETFLKNKKSWQFSLEMS